MIISRRNSAAATGSPHTKERHTDVNTGFESERIFCKLGTLRRCCSINGWRCSQNPRSYPLSFLATPYVLLWCIWWSFRSVYKKTALPRNGADDERQAMFQYLRSAIQRQTVFGCIGIAVALAMGFLLGRLGSH